MEGLTSFERGCVERAMAGDAVMRARTLEWAAINSGSRNLDGLATVADKIGEALGALPELARHCERSEAIHARAVAGRATR